MKEFATKEIYTIFYRVGLKKSTVVLMMDSKLESMEAFGRSRIKGMAGVFDCQQCNIV